jgi:hypothetical protein
MTSLAAMVARDSRGPSSLYLMTDSRITWGESSQHWDAGRKTFASPVGADIFGYCGDAYFMPMTLGQVISIAAAKILDLSSPEADMRHQLILSLLTPSLSMIKTKHVLPMTLFHGARDSELMTSRFRLWRSQFDPKTMSWSDEELVVEDRSYLAAINGSGKTHVESYERKVAKTSAAGTSRAAVHAFCSSLRSSADPFSGGAPQLVGLWRKGPARQFGFFWNGKSFVGGMQVTSDLDRESMDWFNHLFERCDGRTGQRLAGSSSHRSTRLK